MGAFRETPPASPPAGSVGRIKGVAFRTFLVWYAAKHGKHRLAAAGHALPPEHAGAFDSDAPTLGVLPSTWYPGASVHALMDELIRGASMQDRHRMAREGADAVMDATLRGLYRILFEWMATPERYARYAGRLWKSYYDSGSLEIVETTAGFARAVVRDWRTHHPFICDLNREASRAIYEAMGCTDVACERVGCVSDGDDACTFVTRWTR